MEGIERTMQTLHKSAENYNTDAWRKQKYLKVDSLIVLKAYDEFLNALYFKYSNPKFKSAKPKKLVNLITLDELKTIFFDTDIRKTKEAMREIE
jgi:predicted component of type VI protein secretion system